MAKQELHNDLYPSIGLNVQAISADGTTTGVIVDTQGFGAVQFYIVAGTLSDGTYTPLVQEGDEADMADATAVADADLTDTEADAAVSVSNTVKRIGYIGNKRYVRCQIVASSVSSGGTVGVLAVRGFASVAPVAGN